MSELDYSTRQPRITQRRRRRVNREVVNATDLPQDATCEHCQKAIRYARGYGHYVHTHSRRQECGIIKDADGEMIQVMEGESRMLDPGSRILGAEPTEWYYDE